MFWGYYSCLVIGCNSYENRIFAHRNNSYQQMNSRLILVGSGISGSLIGYFLSRLKVDFLVIDDQNQSSPSRVAAGIMHPLVFKRLTKSWRVQDFNEVVYQVYSEIESQTGESFFHKEDYLKVLNSIEEVNNWEAKRAQNDMNELMGEVADNQNMAIKADLGFGMVKHAGYLNTKKFLSACANQLGDRLIQHQFDYSKLVVSEDGVSYKNGELDIQAKHIIFADGPNSANNPYFNWLPYQLVKGEVITIHAPELKLDSIVNQGVFVCPIGEDKYTVGATYDWKNLNQVPTDEGLAELEEKLQKFIQTPYTVVEHKAGIRPAVRERRPFIGKHPKHNNVWLFNGMGSKAVMMAPYWAKHFVNHLINGETLDPEVDIQRYYSIFEENMGHAKN